MATVKKSVLVPYSAAEMFSLVEKVDDYPSFLPWCAGVAHLPSAGAHPIVRVDIHYHGVFAHFTTENESFPPDRIVVALRDGPFRVLEGTWSFRALAENACKVELELHYEFKTHVLEKVIGPVFGHIANTFIDAFVRRAESLHGNSTT